MKKSKKCLRRALNRLEALNLKKLRPGMHPDGNGLYLVVQDSGARSWILRTMVRGRRKDIGLGGLAITSLAEARDEAGKLRAKARKGEDVLEVRRLDKRKANTPTFEDAAQQVHKEVAPTLKNEGNRENWLRSMENHVFPAFGKKTVETVDAADVLRAVGPIWTTKPDMARKTLTRIRRVLDWATIRGWRTVMAGNMTIALPNPCAGIHAALPSQPKEGHHAALPYSDLPALLEKIRVASCSEVLKLALEFTILTTTRTSEALYARKGELDLKAKTWTIPAERLQKEGVRRSGMKEDEPHCVPLSPRCVEIIEQAAQLNGDDDLVFPVSAGKAFSNVAMLKALQRIEGCENLSVHGFRATFKTWAHEKTKFDSLVIEAALAHKVEGIERHYLRTTFFDQRVKLMNDWARFATAAPLATVVKMRR